MVGSFVRVDVRGIEGLFLYLKKVETRTRKEGLEMTKRIAEMVARKARTIVAPYHTGSGRLRDSIKSLPMKNGWYATAGEGTINLNGVNYARFQEQGFSPHIIHRDMLDLKNRSKWRGKFFRVKNFTPFMGPAYRHVLNRLDTELNRTAEKIIRG